jgi:hypothetical protein
MKYIIYFYLWSVMFVLSIVMLVHQITSPQMFSNPIEMIDLFPVVSCVLSFGYVYGLGKEIKIY